MIFTKREQGEKHETYPFARVFQKVDAAFLALEKVLGIQHDFLHQLLQVGLFLEDTSR